MSFRTTRGSERSTRRPRRSSRVHPRVQVGPVDVDVDVGRAARWNIRTRFAGGGGGCGWDWLPPQEAGPTPEGSTRTEHHGFELFADDGVAEAGPPPVQVVSQSVVGPYDTVTVRASQGEALGDWLRANGYAVPAAIQPTIDAFTA